MENTNNLNKDELLEALGRMKINLEKIRDEISDIEYYIRFGKNDLKDR